MMARPSLVAMLSFSAWAFGCGGPPRIDTSSEETASASLKQVRQSLPERVRPAFDQAVTTIVLDRFGEDAPGLTAGGPATFEAAMLKPLNGMTADEVMTEARRIVAEQRANRGTAAREGRRPPP